MFYTPGPKAFAEHQAFTNRLAQHPALNPLPVPRQIEPPRRSVPAQLTLDSSVPDDPVLAELTKRGITEKKACELLAQLSPGQDVLEQLEYLDSVMEQAPPGKFRNPPGLYIRFLEQNGPIPASFISMRKRRLFEKAQQRQHAELARQAQLEIAYDEYRQRESERFCQEELSQDEYQNLLKKCRGENRRTFPQFGSQELDRLAQAVLILELREAGQVPILLFEHFGQQQKSMAERSKKK